MLLLDFFQYYQRKHEQKSYKNPSIDILSPELISLGIGPRLTFQKHSADHQD